MLSRVHWVNKSKEFFSLPHLVCLHANLVWQSCSFASICLCWCLTVFASIGAFSVFACSVDCVLKFSVDHCNLQLNLFRKYPRTLRRSRALDGSQEGSLDEMPACGTKRRMTIHTPEAGSLRLSSLKTKKFSKKQHSRDSAQGDMTSHVPRCAPAAHSLCLCGVNMTKKNF